MDDITQRALDAELHRGHLPAAEQARLAEAERLFAAVVGAVDERPIPDLAPAVMARIANNKQAAPSSRASWLGWLWQPRPLALQWRPAYGLAAALVVIAAALTLRGGDPAQLPTANGNQILARFQLNAPDAHQVSLAGEFTEWKPNVQLTRNDAGVWTVVVPLDPGVHQYAFVVDGDRWMPDPTTPSYDDGFGGLNSRLALLAADEVRQ